MGSDTKISLLGRGNFVWGTQNISSINHGGEILCAFICVFYTKSLLPREGKFCVPEILSPCQSRAGKLELGLRLGLGLGLGLCD